MSAMILKVDVGVKRFLDELYYVDMGVVHNRRWQWLTP